MPIGQHISHSPDLVSLRTSFSAIFSLFLSSDISLSEMPLVYIAGASTLRWTVFSLSLHLV
jgi:hypothetical protein